MADSALYKLLEFVKPENNFTLEQFLTLKDLVNMVMDKYSDITEILGHCDVQDNKPNCPGFNVKEWLNKEAINVA